jgi:hypothetical protein
MHTMIDDARPIQFDTTSPVLFAVALLLLRESIGL